MTEILELGKVDFVSLYRDDHAGLSFRIGIRFGGLSQSFGGYSLDDWSEADDRRVGTAAGLDLLLRILNLFKVDRLEDIEGRTVFALRADNRGEIVGLELPSFDGGKRLTIEDWRKRWFGSDAGAVGNIPKAPKGGTVNVTFKLSNGEIAKLQEIREQFVKDELQVSKDALYGGASLQETLSLMIEMHEVRLGTA